MNAEEFPPAWKHHVKRIPGFFATERHCGPPTTLSCPEAQSRGSVTSLHQHSCGTALFLSLCDVRGKQMDTSVRSGVRPPWPRPDHRCVSTLVPSHVGSAALCWCHAHSHWCFSTFFSYISKWNLRDTYAYKNLYICKHFFKRSCAHQTKKLQNSFFSKGQVLGARGGCLSTRVANVAILTPAFLPLLHIPLISD